MESVLIIFFVLAVLAAIAYIAYLRHEVVLLNKSKDYSDAVVADRRTRVKKLEETRLKEETEKRNEDAKKIGTATAANGLDKLLSSTHSRRP